MPAARQEDVSRFEIAMGDALAMCGVQSIGHFDAQIYELLGVRRPPMQGLPQCAPFQIFHYDERASFMLSDLRKWCRCWRDLTLRPCALHAGSARKPSYPLPIHRAGI